MTILLLRHGDAVAEARGLCDASRYLSEAGRDDARAVGAALARSGVAVTAVVASPLVRAVQTAEIVAALVAPALPVRIEETLAPGGSMRAAASAIRRGVLAVGHEPSISGVAALLTGQNDFPAFKKAQVLAIDDGQPTWWLVPGDDAPRRWER